MEPGERVVTSLSDIDRAAVGDRSERPVAIWLLAVAVLVFAMVILGGVTRLTHSGLSMVEWRPLIGILPPLSQADWLEVFEKYKQFPEYQQVNRGMSLAEFKRIFAFEYAHRVLGRLIGLAFALPFLWFLATGRIRRRRLLPLLGLFAAGGLQGLIGWWMVKSGLVDRPDVSHYRLTVHLGVAVAIFGGLIWYAATLWPVAGLADRGAHRLAVVAVALIFGQILIGAMVAGLDAGYVYNTFPDMNGDWLAEDIWYLEPGWRNLIDNPATVQFVHRCGAYLAVLAVALLWWRARRTAPLPANLSLAAVALQFGLGVLTLILVMPAPLAAAHQAMALVLFGCVLLTAHRVRAV